MASHLGADHVLAKPFDLRNLIAWVRAKSVQEAGSA